MLWFMELGRYFKLAVRIILCDRRAMDEAAANPSYTWPGAALLLLTAALGTVLQASTQNLDLLRAIFIGPSRAFAIRRISWHALPAVCAGAAPRLT